MTEIFYGLRTIQSCNMQLHFIFLRIKLLYIPYSIYIRCIYLYFSRLQ